MPLRTEIVPKDKIERIWPQLEEWVKNALGNDKSYTTEDVKQACLTHMNLGVIYAPELTGFMIFQIFDSPQCKSAYSPWLGGKDLAMWVEHAITEFKGFLRGQGVKQYSFIGRTAWKRLVKADYEGTFYLMTL